jgi:hypothetical protein
VRPSEIIHTKNLGKKNSYENKDYTKEKINLGKAQEIPKKKKTSNQKQTKHPSNPLFYTPSTTLHHLPFS